MFIATHSLSIHYHPSFNTKYSTHSLLTHYHSQLNKSSPPNI